MWRRIFFVFFIPLCICGGFVFFILQNPAFFEWLLPRSIAHQGSPYQLTALKIGKQEFLPPGQLVWQDVRAQIKDQHTVYTIAVKEIGIGGLETVLQNNGVVACAVDHLTLQSGSLEIQDLIGTVQIDLVEKKFSKMRGALMIAAIRFDPYRLNKFSVNFSGDGSELNTQNFSAQTYDGILQGNLRMTFKPRERYNLILNLKGINFKTFAEAQQAPVSVVGKVGGEIVLNGNLTGVRSLQMDLNLEQGGKMKGELLSFVVQYLPPSIERKKLLRKRRSSL